jgi:hypothetical protein
MQRVHNNNDPETDGQIRTQSTAANLNILVFEWGLKVNKNNRQQLAQGGPLSVVWLKSDNLKQTQSTV